MSNRRFEMYQYRQIIMRLRMGDTVRGLAREKLADRKTIGKIRAIAQAKGWLDSQNTMPGDDNKEHYHSGIAWLTPESVHYQRDQAILEQ